MEVLFLLIGFIFALALIASPFVVVVLFGKLKALRDEVGRLALALKGTNERLQRLEVPRPHETAAAEALVREPLAQAAKAPEKPAAPREEPQETTEAGALIRETFDQAAKAPVEKRQEEPQSARPARPQPPAGPGWEKRLAENWMVWLGGVALALGGAFLVKYSIDMGLLTPALRVGLGLLLGAGLLAGAHVTWQREQKGLDGAAAGVPSHVPSALAAAGLADIFASLYAAYQLYGLLPAGLAFPLLALTALAAILLSLRYGPFVAGLGLLSAFAVPVLVHTDTPRIGLLLAYLTLISAAALILQRFRPWIWISWVVLGVAWTWAAAVSFSGNFMAHDVSGRCEIFALAEIVLFAFFRLGLPGGNPLLRSIDGLPVRVVVRAAFWSLSLLLLTMVGLDDYSSPGLIAAAFAALFMLWIAYQDQALDDVLVAPALLWLGLFLIWPVYTPAGGAEPAIMVLTALFTGGLGFAVLGRVRRPVLWAALSAGMPLAILVIAYGTRRGDLSDHGFAVLGALLASANLAAATVVSRKRAPGNAYETALALYAVGMLGALALATTMLLREAWLTVGFALYLPAIAWVEGRIRLKALRHLTLILAAVVLARLTLNPALLDYSRDSTHAFTWIFYGYGLPALCFVAAAQSFRRRQDDLLVALLEAGWALLVALFATFELRLAMGMDPLRFGMGGLAETATQTLSWLVLGVALAWMGESRGRPVLRWSGLSLGFLATLEILFKQVLIDNPARTGAAVGALPVFNTLLLAYALPALVFALTGLKRLGPWLLWCPARYLALPLGLLWMTLEVRHAFRGSVLTFGRCGDAEWYAYSLAWMGAAVLCLTAGVLKNNTLRQLGLAGIGLVSAKVFLSDIASLGGLWRVVSFLGLGAVLVAIGYTYRRLLPGEGKKVG